MNDPKKLLQGLIGKWEGTCLTWFEPGELADESPIQGEILALLGGRFFRHRYESTIRGQARCGEETIAYNSVTKQFEVAWMDDFHMNYGIMFSTGESSEEGFAVVGEYAVGPGNPNWGWRTVYARTNDDRLVITAYNITPEGEAAKAVESTYKRVAAVE